MPQGVAIADLITMGRVTLSLRWVMGSDILILLQKWQLALTRSESNIDYRVEAAERKLRIAGPTSNSETTSLAAPS
jgi:hypothetical protein